MWRQQLAGRLERPQDWSKQSPKGRLKNHACSSRRQGSAGGTLGAVRPDPWSAEALADILGRVINT